MVQTASAYAPFVSELSLERVRSWYAEQPRVVLVADALVTDEADRVLLVKPTYKSGWLRPGGIVEHDEAPHVGAERELREETGLRRRAGRLLAVEWCRMFDQEDLPILVHTFDFGTVSSGEPIVVPEAEISGYGFFEEDKAERRLAPYDRARFKAALTARAAGATAYLADGLLVGN